MSHPPRRYGNGLYAQFSCISSIFDLYELLFFSVPEVVTDISWDYLNNSNLKVMWKRPSSSLRHFNVSLIPLDAFNPIITVLVNGSRANAEVCTTVGASRCCVSKNFSFNALNFGRCLVSNHLYPIS